MYLKKRGEGGREETQSGGVERRFQLDSSLVPIQTFVNGTPVAAAAAAASNAANGTSSKMLAAIAPQNHHGLRRTISVSEEIDE